MNTRFYYLVTALFSLICLALGALFLSRLAPEIAVTVIGVMCGMLTALPISIALIYAIARSRENILREYYAAQAESNDAPSITIIAPVSSQSLTLRK